MSVNERFDILEPDDERPMPTRTSPRLDLLGDVLYGQALEEVGDRSLVDRYPHWYPIRGGHDDGH